MSLHVEGRRETEGMEAIQLKCYRTSHNRKNTYVFGLGGGDGNGEKGEISTHVQEIQKSRLMMDWRKGVIEMESVVLEG